MAAILQTLGIDWQILLAQVINFVIVMVLLAKFVYKPLLKLIDDRREAVKRSMEQVAEIERQKQESESSRQATLLKADQEAGAILARAKADAEEMKAKILASAQTEADQIRIKGEQQLEDERTHVFHDVQDTMAKVVITLSERIIRREFSDADQKRLMKDLETELPKLLKA